MSLIVDVAADRQRLPLSRARVKDIAAAVLKAERVSNALISIAFISKREIAGLNRRHLGHTGPTDVISFAFGRAGGASDAGRTGGTRATRGPREGQPIVGDIYIAPDVARENAARYHTGVREELARLVIHGTLHVLGYDHPDGEDRTASEMWRRQERLLAALRRRSERGAAR